MSHNILKSLEGLRSKEPYYRNDVFKEYARLDFSNSYESYGKSKQEYNDYMKELISSGLFHQSCILSGWHWFCSSGNIELVKYIHESSYGQSLDIERKGRGLEGACMYGHFQVVQFILKDLNLDSENPDKIQVFLNKGLLNACMNKKFELGYYLLTNSDLKNHALINPIKKLELLDSVCKGDEGIDILKYFLSEEMVKDYEVIIFTRHKNKDPEKKLLNTIIFDWNVSYSPEIKNFILSSKDGELRKMFEARQLKEQLNEELNEKSFSRKNKL